MKKYFLYELKKNAYTIGVIALVMTLIYILPMMGMLGFSWLFGYREAGTFVWLISLLAGFLAAGVPMRVFAYRTKRRSVDLYYSLPLSHTKILAVKFLIGLIAVFAPYTASYWIGASLDTIASGNPYAVYYIPQFFASIIPIYIIYAISTFAFTRANSVRDGVLFVIFWAFVVALVMSVLEELTTRRYYSLDGSYHEYLYTVSYINSYRYLPFSPLDFVTAHFQRLIRGGGTMKYDFETVSLVNLILGFTLTTLMAAGSTVGLFLLERRVKGENAGQISESPFGYKTMLPIYTVCLAGICDSVILYIMIAVGAYLLTASYRRTLKIGTRQAIILAASLVAGIILWAIFYYFPQYVYIDPPQTFVE